MTPMLLFWYLLAFALGLFVLGVALLALFAGYCYLTAPTETAKRKVN